MGGAACGGRVDRDNDRGLTGSGTPGPRPTSGRPIPSRPPLPPVSAPAVAAEIAEEYCKTFSSCCVSVKQPPIDVARCRELVSASVTPPLEKAIASARNAIGPSEVATCVEAIQTRIAACGRSDFAWWTRGAPALLAPDSVQSACAPLLGPASSTSGQACESGSSGAACTGGATCAIDVCADLASTGDACVSDAGGKAVCADGLTCAADVCAARAFRASGEPCTEDGECRLGLVCFDGACDGARSHPKQYRERHSPYRVGADTCRIFSSL